MIMNINNSIVNHLLKRHSNLNILAILNNLPDILKIYIKIYYRNCQVE